MAEDGEHSDVRTHVDDGGAIGQSNSVANVGPASEDFVEEVAGLVGVDAENVDLLVRTCSFARSSADEESTPTGKAKPAALVRARPQPQMHQHLP
jgi:hypothetical protein